MTSYPPCTNMRGQRIGVVSPNLASEQWTESELEDEIRELVYEYEQHMHASRISGVKEALEIVLTGTADLAEDVIKLRLGKIAKLVAATVNRRATLLREESTAPGRELALIPEARRVFAQAAAA